MPSTFETGHATIIANFERLLAFVRTYGSSYNPVKPELQLVNLENSLLTAKASLAQVVARNTDYNNKVNERKIAFSSLKSFSTRLINALQITDASEELISDAKGFRRKIAGQRASVTTNFSLDLNVPSNNRHSVSQQSYVQQVQHFAGLVSVIQSEPSYSPNEPDFQVQNLQSKQDELSLKNTEVMNAYSLLSHARTQRNNLLYIDDNSIAELGAQIKKYIKMAYGLKSVEYSKIKSLSFIKRKV